MVDYSNIQINLVSKDTFERMSSAERLQFIINEVKQGKVLILEQGLTATEQFELNKLTMSEIDHESFVGIEMPGFASEVKKPGILDRLFRRRSAPRMMAVGPAKLMRIIKKEPSLIQTVVVPLSRGIAEQAEGEGIPIDDVEDGTTPEALSLDEDEELPDGQVRLEEFKRNSGESPGEQAGSEELEMLIGPELREENPEDTGARDDNTVDERGRVDDESNPSSEARGTDEPRPSDEEQREEKGYVLRKIKEEGEEE